eukprot:1014614-Pelagomonas_calceolata.AAC.1
MSRCSAGLSAVGWLVRRVSSVVSKPTAPSRHAQGLTGPPLRDDPPTSSSLASFLAKLPCVTTVEENMCFILGLIARTPVTHRNCILPNRRFKFQSLHETGTCPVFGKVVTVDST